MSRAPRARAFARVVLVARARVVVDDLVALDVAGVARIDGRRVRRARPRRRRPSRASFKRPASPSPTAEIRVFAGPCVARIERRAARAR
jgi:hypothetical protein